MLPVVEPDGRSTALRILLYSIALIPVSLVPSFTGMAGSAYIAGATLLGFALLWFSLRLVRLDALPSTAQSKLRARQLLQATVIYLPLLFALMMLNPVSS